MRNPGIDHPIVRTKTSIAGRGNNPISRGMISIATTDSEGAYARVHEEGSNAAAEITAMLPKRLFILFAHTIHTHTKHSMQTATPKNM